MHSIGSYLLGCCKSTYNVVYRTMRWEITGLLEVGRNNRVPPCLDRLLQSPPQQEVKQYRVDLLQVSPPFHVNRHRKFLLAPEPKKTQNQVSVSKITTQKRRVRKPGILSKELLRLSSRHFNTGSAPVKSSSRLSAVVKSVNQPKRALKTQPGHPHKQP